MSPDTDIFTWLPTCTGEEGWRLSYIDFTRACSLYLFRGLYQARFLVVYEGRLLEEVGSEAGQISLREHGLHNRIVEILLVHFSARNRHVPATNTVLNILIQKQMFR